jgi:hypothetical protein
MDCRKIVSIVKRWGYGAASHQYLVDVYGMTPKEAEECVKEVGIYLGHWVPPSPPEESAPRLSPPGVPGRRPRL